MKFLVLILAFSFIAGEEQLVPDYKLNDPRHPATIAKSKSLKKFVKFVEENNLNVTLIVSTINKWSNGNTKELGAFSITFPPSDLKRATVKLAKKDALQFLKIATDDKLPAKVVISNKNQLNSWTNTENGVPNTESHKILTSHSNKLGVNAVNFATQWTFITRGPDGQDRTTRVIHGNAEVEILDKDCLSENEVEIIKNSLMTTNFQYAPEYVPRALVLLLQEKLPDNNWQVAETDGKGYINAKKWILLKIFDTTYTVFSI